MKLIKVITYYYQHIMYVLWQLHIYVSKGYQVCYTFEDFRPFASLMLIICFLLAWPAYEYVNDGNNLVVALVIGGVGTLLVIIGHGFASKYPLDITVNQPTKFISRADHVMRPQEGLIEFATKNIMKSNFKALSYQELVIGLLMIFLLILGVLAVVAAIASNAFYS